MELCSIDQLKNLCEEFNITEEILRKDVRILMEWLEQQPHLPNIKDEKFLQIYFLRCKTSLDKTKKMLEEYYIFKGQLPNIFKNRDLNSAEFKKCFDLAMFYSSTKITENGIGIMIFRINNINDSRFPSNTEYMKYILVNMLTVMLMSPNRKFILISDFRNMSMSFVTWLLGMLKNLLTLWLKSIPIRVEKMYLLHSSFAAVQGLILIARKISKKIFEDRMITWDKDGRELGKELSLPKDIIPFEYGGTAGKFADLAEQSFERMKSWEQWLNEEEKYVPDLSKRPKDQENTDSIAEFGTEGSFRKINID